MDSPSLHILDVGHGNCCIVLDEGGATIIDAGHMHRHTDFLRARKIKRIEAVLISHADSDHIAGVITLLLSEEFDVLRVYLNPDASKHTDDWLALRKALKFARENHGTEVHTQLTTTDSKTLHRGGLNIEVLAPFPEISAGGPGADDFEGHKIKSNSMSAVIRIAKSDHPTLLLTADLDSSGLRYLMEARTDLQAEVLVFPHHGGGVGDIRSAEFAARLFDIVKPKIVIFSIGRGKYGLPLPAIVDRVRAANVMCTQLSTRCSTRLPVRVVSGAFRPQRPIPQNSCAGTISITFLGEEISVYPDPRTHRDFVTTFVPFGMCQARVTAM